MEIKLDILNFCKCIDCQEMRRVEINYHDSDYTVVAAECDNQIDNSDTGCSWLLDPYAIRSCNYFKRIN